MPRRYVLGDADANTLNNETKDLFICPDCSFSFSAVHECDDILGGYECPVCETKELTEKLKLLHLEFDEYKSEAIQAIDELKEYKDAYYSLRSAGTKLSSIKSNVSN